MKSNKLISEAVQGVGCFLLFVVFVIFVILRLLTVNFPNQFLWAERFELLVELAAAGSCILLGCLLPTYAIWFHTKDKFLDAKAAKNWLIVSAATASLPLWSGIFWFRIGVPPTPDPTLFGIGTFYPAEIASLVLAILACTKIRNFLHQSTWPWKILGIAGLVLVNVAFFILPVVWTILTAKAASSSLRLAELIPDPNSGADDPILIAHISDLHISDESTTRDGKLPGNSRLPALLLEIAKHRPQYVVISGDLTDKGDARQWSILKTFLANLSPNTRVLMTPGNHDLNQFFGYDPGSLDLGASDASVTTDLNKVPRLARMFIVQSEYLPDMLNGSHDATLKDLIHDIPTKATMKDLKKEINLCSDKCKSSIYVEEIPGMLEAECASRCVEDWRFLRFWYFNTFQQEFPLMYIDEPNHVAFFSLASVFSNSDTPGQNAIGFIDDDQITKTGQLLRSLPTTIHLIVFALHHPLFYTQQPPLPSFDLSDLRHPLALWNRFYLSDWFLSVFLKNNSTQAKKFYVTISDELRKRPDVSIIVMFGHRHERSLSQLGNMILEEAPNVATEKPSDYGFYGVAVGPDSAVHVRWWTVH